MTIVGGAYSAPFSGFYPRLISDVPATTVLDLKIPWKECIRMKTLPGSQTALAQTRTQSLLLLALWFMGFSGLFLALSRKPLRHRSSRNEWRLGTSLALAHAEKNLRTRKDAGRVRTRESLVPRAFRYLNHLERPNGRSVEMLTTARHAIFLKNNAGV